MTIHCFGCGRFVKIGNGEVAKTKGREQYFCKACVAERVAFEGKERGYPATFADYMGRKVEYV